MGQEKNCFFLPDNLEDVHLLPDIFLRKCVVPALTKLDAYGIGLECLDCCPDILDALLGYVGRADKINVPAFDLKMRYPLRKLQTLVCHVKPFPYNNLP